MRAKVVLARAHKTLAARDRLSVDLQRRKAEIEHSRAELRAVIEQSRALRRERRTLGLCER